MDKLGQRILDDTRDVQAKRNKAKQLEAEAKQLRNEADEIERYLKLARIANA